MFELCTYVQALFRTFPAKSTCMHCEICRTKEPNRRDAATPPPDYCSAPAIEAHLKLPITMSGIHHHALSRKGKSLESPSFGIDNDDSRDHVSHTHISDAFDASKPCDCGGTCTIEALRSSKSEQIRHHAIRCVLSSRPTS